MKLGIVGAGFAAAFHCESLVGLCSLPFEIAGVTSLRPESREKFGRQRKVRVFSSFEEMLKEVDAVDICVPPYAHEEMIVRAAEAGRLHALQKLRFQCISRCSSNHATRASEARLPSSPLNPCPAPSITISLLVT